MGFSNLFLLVLLQFSLRTQIWGHNSTLAPAFLTLSIKRRDQFWP